MSVRIDRRQSGCRLRDIRILEALLEQRGIYDKFSCIEDILYSKHKPKGSAADKKH